MYRRDWGEVTFVYSNMVPQWQVVNVINPKDIEEAVQARSKLQRSTMQVLTGTNGVDKLTLNNPCQHHTRSVTVTLFLCKDVCEQAGWGRALRAERRVGRGVH